MTIPIFEETEVRSFRRSASCNRRWDDLWRDFPRINSKISTSGSSPNIWSSGIIWYRFWSPNGLSGESISGWLFQDYPTGQNLLREANGLNARLAGGAFCAHGDKHIYSFQFLGIQVPWQIFSWLFAQASLMFKQHYILALDYALNMSMYRNIARLVLRLCLWFDVSVTWCFSMQRQNICIGLRAGSVRHNMRATGQQ